MEGGFGPRTVAAFWHFPVATWKCEIYGSKFYGGWVAMGRLFSPRLAFPLFSWGHARPGTGRNTTMWDTIIAASPRSDGFAKAPHTSKKFIDAAKMFLVK